MLGEDPCTISLVTANGTFVDDLTKFATSGKFQRKKNAVSQFNGTFNSDMDSFSTMSKLDYWSMYIRCERDKRDQWEGPVTNVEDNDGVITVVASDITAYWSRSLVKNHSFVGEDVAAIAQSIIESTFATSIYGEPFLETSVVGALLDRDFSESDYKLLSDIFSDLPGLDWYAFGRTVYLFGASREPVSSFKINDESWFPLPAVERSGEKYANRVVVKGSGVTGIAEAPLDEIDYYGLIVRRSELTSATSQTAVDKEAQAILARARDATFFNTDSLSVLRPTVNTKLENVVPGAYVDVDHSITGRPLSRQLRIDTVEVDCLLGTTAISLEPLGVPDETTAI